MLPVNPYRTAPGSLPPELAGRDSEQGAARYAIAMTNSGAAPKPIVFTGLRGMGKTALLRRCAAEARALGGIVISAESDKELRFGDVMRRELTAALRDSDSLPTRLATGIRRVVEALPKISYDIPGAGEVAISSNDLQEADTVDADSLEDVLLKLNTQVRQHERFLMLGIDEIQESPLPDLLQIVRAVHKTAGTDEPILLIGAGLPNSPGVLKSTRTYTERYAYLRLELLGRIATTDAVDIPARKLHVRWDEAAAERVYSLSQGYPYFVQEYASAAWLTRTSSTITEADVDRVAIGVRSMLDESIYARQFSQISPREAVYILALHALGSGTHYSDEVADRLKLTSANLGSVRAQLIKKDVLFSPARGLTEFRLPLSDDYIDRHADEIHKRAELGRNALNDRS